MIEFGVTVRDKITGFVGTVTASAEYITGCRQFLVAPTISDDGAFREPHWFDEDRLTVVNTMKKTIARTAAAAGGDVAAPKR